MQDAVRVELVPCADTVDGGGHRWIARVNGAEIPVVGYEVGNTEDGRVSVMLGVTADSVSIDCLSLGAPTPMVRPAVPVSKKAGIWGDPAAPDPRAGTPGWEQAFVNG